MTELTNNIPLDKYICVLDFEATCEKDKLINNQEIIEFPSILYKVKNFNKDNTEYEKIG